MMSNNAKRAKIETSKNENTVSDKSDEKAKIQSQTTSFDFQLNVIYGDLFVDNPDLTCSLAHCVSRDLSMGAGIAPLFIKKFGRKDELFQANAKIGQAAILNCDQNKFIYNLVTKEKYYGKPTYESLEQSLVFMRNHAVEHKVHKIAMPKIGCGLDLLNWDVVSDLIKKVFRETSIKITVFYFDSPKKPR